MTRIEIPNYCIDCPIYGNSNCSLYPQQLNISGFNRSLRETCGTIEDRETLASKLTPVEASMIKDAIRNRERVSIEDKFTPNKIFPLDLSASIFLKETP